MALVYTLIIVLPVIFIFMICVAIGAAGSKTYRAGKRAYGDLKPYINNVSASVSKAQRMGADFAERGQKLGQTIEEIGGRWAFIEESFSETASSPLIKLAGMAGRFAGRE